MFLQFHVAKDASGLQCYIHNYNAERADVEWDTEGRMLHKGICKEHMRSILESCMIGQITLRENANSFDQHKQVAGKWGIWMYEQQGLSRKYNSLTTVKTLAMLLQGAKARWSQTNRKTPRYGFLSEGKDFIFFVNPI